MKVFLTIVAMAVFWPASHALAQNWAVDAFGGLRIATELSYDDVDYDMDTGSMFGVALYRRNLLENWEFGLDYSESGADAEAEPFGIDSRALMAVARYSFPTAGQFSYFAKAGFGAMEVSFDGSGIFLDQSGSDTVSGGQVSIGALYPLGSATVFAELRHQRAFADPVVDGTSFSFDSSDLLIGLTFGF